MIFGENTMLEVPVGRYIARFVGTEDRPPIQDSRFGNSEAPRMGWLFEVAQGPFQGKRISQESGCRATKNSTAARMMLGLQGGQLAVGQRVNIDAFVGRLYSVKVAVNDKSEKGNLHVADLEPYSRGQAAPATPTAPTTPATPSVSSLPPAPPPDDTIPF
jgi:hypothetical protein